MRFVGTESKHGISAVRKRYGLEFLSIVVFSLALLRFGTETSHIVLKNYGVLEFRHPAAENNSTNGSIEESAFEEMIPLERNATISSDIVGMTHIPKEASIVVHLKKNRTCDHPQLIGRLSGPVLTTIEWDQHITTAENGNGTDGSDNKSNSFNHSTDALKGYYTTPMPGQYFLEVIVTLCVNLEMDTNYKPLCVQDSSFNRITGSNASIGVTSVDPFLVRSMEQNGSSIEIISPEAKASNTKIGFWYNTISSEPHAPVFTRHQPGALCPKGPALGLPQCTVPADLSRFDPYNNGFRFANRHSSDLASLLRRQPETTKVCFVGASHARVLREKTLAIVSGIKNATVEIIWKEIRFAQQFAKHQMKSLVDGKCSKVVAGTGQWDASKFKPPTMFHDFQNHLDTAMGNMAEAFENTSIDFYFRTMHYNPLGNLISSCPPSDWRNPPVVDMYNRIIRESTAKYNVTLIDTTDITGSMWDAAPDWCHLDNTVGETEAGYILHTIFQDV